MEGIEKRRKGVKKMGRRREKLEVPVGKEGTGLRVSPAVFM